MREKYIFRLVMVGVLFYPAYRLFEAVSILGVGDLEEARKAVVAYQAGVWLAWLVLAGLAVYYKWRSGRNSPFYYTYGFLLVAFGVYGYLEQSLVNLYELYTGFGDTYTMGIIMAFKSIVTSCTLTLALQAAVWWFTRTPDPE